LPFAPGLALVRSATTPSGPFDADIALSLNVIDTDGVVFASNPARFGQASAGNGMAFSNGKQMRFGRLRLENAVGSEKLDLPIAIQTQYWTGTAFQTNSADNCTTLSAANISLSDHFGGITPANTPNANITVGGAFSAGVGSLTLTKPSPAPGSPGAVTLTVNLTAEAKSYLKGNWGVATYTADPKSRAAFGLYGGQPHNFIYFRENY
jgi:MSHA biogenesis protein MshQ